MMCKQERRLSNHATYGKLFHRVVVNAVIVHCSFSA